MEMYWDSERAGLAHPENGSLREHLTAQQADGRHRALEADSEGTAGNRKSLQKGHCHQRREDSFTVWVVMPRPGLRGRL